MIENLISFVVIGRNEGFFLEKCFESIERIIKRTMTLDFEIIYVDSGSTDDSLSIAKRYATKVISIIGQQNAAISRNEGARNSRGDFLIFLDGDMELELSFFEKFFLKSEVLHCDYFSGDIFNIYYDSTGNYVGEGFYYRDQLKKDEYLPFTGGFFCIQRKIWNSVGGMREKYRRSQDLDFGYRLAKNGIFINRKKNLAIRHNTISYFEKGRMWKMLLKNDFGYRAMLYRDHITNVKIYIRVLRDDYSFLFLLLSTFYYLLEGGEIIFVFYLVVVLLRAGFQSTEDKNSRFLKLLFLLFKDIQMVYSLVFFFPSKKKKYSVEIIKE
jgi:glycosyltransferase involved in cell wall biosynthesis